MTVATADAEQAIQTTLQEMEALASRGLLIYALLDAAQPALNWQALLKIFEPSALHPLFAGLPEDSAKEAGPLLWPIEWRALRSDPLRWLLMQEQQSPCVTWLASPATPPQLIAHLQSRLFTHTTGGAEVMLRFYDPRVLDLLMNNVYDDAQRRELAGPIHQWWLWSTERGRQRLRFA